MSRTHPRPTLTRPDFWVVDGPVPFAWDLDAATPREPRRSGDGDFPGLVTLPFPPESARSGVGLSHRHGTLWYRITVPPDAARAGRRPGMRLLLHLEAVFGSTRVWANGRLVGTTTAGYSQQSFDLMAALHDGEDDDRDVVVVEVDVDHADLSRPRGKQDWQDAPHGIWYGRSSGIWRDVWFEAVPAHRVDAATFTTDLDACCVRLDLDLSWSAEAGTTVQVRLLHDDALVADLTSSVSGRQATVTVPLPALRNEHERPALLWSPGTPTLLTARIALRADGRVVDEVGSYLGLREVHTDGRDLLLNHHPVYFNGVLEQYYWRDSHFTAPSDDDRRAEAEAVVALGFNGVRLHQLSPDPRFLYWCDRLGLLVWAELPSSYEFGPATVAALTLEWLGIVRQAAAHPSVVTWVPLNESWGVPAVARRPEQQALALSLANLARALDPTRPVISNDGWEHVASDVLGFHDYTQDARELAARFGDGSWMSHDAPGAGVAGRRAVVSAAQPTDVPVMLSEFGGVSFDPSGTDGSWGYAAVTSADAFARRLADLVAAVRSVPTLAGACYTQLTDTLQETNGLLDDERRPKIPLEELRGIFGRPA